MFRTCPLLIRRQAVNGTLSVEDGIDPTHRLSCDWRFADLGQFEQFAPAVCPVSRLDDRAWPTSPEVKIIEPAIGVSLKNPLYSARCFLGR